MPDPDLSEIKQGLSRNVQAVGRMINSKKQLSHDDLTSLRDTLNTAAETVQIIRDITFGEK